MWMVIVTLVVILFAANIYATWLVLQEESFESQQKALQVVLIWLIPLLGSLFFINFIRSERKEASSYSHRNDINPVDHSVYDTQSHSSGDYSDS